MSGLKKIPKVVVDQNLTLNVVLVEGSFALFNIDWGDGGDNDTVSDNKDNTVRKKV